MTSRVSFNTIFPVSFENHVRVMSLSQDMIYAATRGRVVPPKLIALPMAVKHLTCSEQHVVLLNRYGHGVSEATLPRLETGITLNVLHKDIENIFQ